MDDVAGTEPHEPAHACGAVHGIVLVALLYSGWELEFGWKVSDEHKALGAAWQMPFTFSRALSLPTATQVATQKKYRKRGKGSLPALVSR